MNQKQHDMLRLSAVQFAAWELHMYLDTHPHDKAAKEKYYKYDNEYKVLSAEYEKKYGPLKQQTSEGAEWLSDPWPWDKSKECDC